MMILLMLLLQCMDDAGDANDNAEAADVMKHILCNELDSNPIRKHLCFASNYCIIS
jgi:hypothetical protein